MPHRILGNQPLSGVVVRETRSRIGRIFSRVLPPGLKLQAHYHELSVVTVITDGGFCEGFSRVKQSCSPGDVRLLPAGDRHTNAVEVRSNCLQIEIDPALLATATDITGTFILKGQIAGELVGVLGSRLVQESCSRDQDSELAMEALLLDLLSYAGRRAFARGQARPPWLRRVSQYVRDAYPERISLKALADLAGVHPVHVSREFHRFHGCTLGDFIRRLRLERATELMRHSKLSLCAIAAECGFSDQSHFVTTFRRYLRTNPKNYRKSLVDLA